MKNPFFQEKSRDVLLNLGESGGAYVTEVSRAINGTYAHVFNIIKDFEKLGIVSSKKEGRIKFVKLTEKGSELAKLMQSFQNVLKAKKVKPKAKVKKEIKPIKVLEGAANRLDRYKTALETLNNDITSKKIKKANAARMLGRYKALVTKSRPRTKKGRSLKDKTLQVIENAQKSLETLQK